MQKMHIRKIIFYRKISTNKFLPFFLDGEKIDEFTLGKIRRMPFLRVIINFSRIYL